MRVVGDIAGLSKNVSITEKTMFVGCKTKNKNKYKKSTNLKKKSQVFCRRVSVSIMVKIIFQ